MSFIQVDQEFVVETDTTVNNIGEDIMGKQARIRQHGKLSMANSAMVRSITLSVGPTSHNSTQSDHIVTKPSGAKAPFARR